jgi:signal transduction histidine kinase
VGRRVQAGDERNLSIRFKLLLAALAIVATSLTLSGALIGVLVSRLEVRNAQDQLVRGVSLLRPVVVAADCAVRDPVTRKCTLRVRNEAEFIEDVSSRIGATTLDGGRVILLDRTSIPPAVAYDSDGALPPGTPVSPPGSGQVSGGQRVYTGVVQLGGRGYVVAATRLSGVRFAGWLLLARPLDAVTAQATPQLLRDILISGAAAMALAVVVTLALGRALSGPLDELKAAAEDVAAGNYARRIRGPGRDEIGVVAQSFNRMAEKVESARRLQRDFLANVSHELKTPLTSLIGFSQALMDGSLQTDEEKVRAAGILHAESRRVLRMSQELLDLARVEAGQITISPEPVDLAAQLEQELGIVGQRAEARGLDLRRELPPGLPPVHADPERLHQILENLLDNAVKYAPEGTRVRVAVEQPAPERLRTVIENQVGAQPPDPDRMFDRFYRADPSRSSGAGGVGLGLAISRELAAAQHGTLGATLNGAGRLAVALELPATALRLPAVGSEGESLGRLSPQALLPPPPSR